MTKRLDEATIEALAKRLEKLVLKVEILFKELEQLVEKLEVRVDEEANKEYAALWRCPPTRH